MNSTDYLAMFFGSPQPLSPAAIAISLSLSFLLGLVTAIVYQYTFRGFTYSRSFIHSIVIGGMVTCMLVMAGGDNMARGRGVLGTLAIIRFRTPIRDARDAMFLFTGLGCGIACGAGTYTVAVAGVAAINLAAVVLHWLPFASRRDYEGILRFGMRTVDPDADGELREILVTHCSSYALLGIRDAVQGEEAEVSYMVRLLDPSYQRDLVKALQRAGRFTAPQLILQRSTVEL